MCGDRTPDLSPPIGKHVPSLPHMLSWGVWKGVHWGCALPWRASAKLVIPEPDIRDSRMGGFVVSLLYLQVSSRTSGGLQTVSGARKAESTQVTSSKPAGWDRNLRSFQVLPFQLAHARNPSNYEVQ